MFTKDTYNVPIRILGKANISCIFFKETKQDEIQLLWLQLSELATLALKILSAEKLLTSQGLLHQVIGCNKSFQKGAGEWVS